MTRFLDRFVRAMALSVRMPRLALVLVLAIGCGPIEYVGQVTRGASNAVEQARAANAAKYAPYWWTRAIEYLDKAREQAAHANFGAANRFGKISAEAAEHARVDAIRRAGDPSSMDEITPPPRAREKPAPSRGGGGLAPVIDEDAGDDETPPGLGDTP